MGRLTSGYTTGACAAAAAKGAALMLRSGRRLDRVAVTLPRGEEAIFHLHGQRFDENSASCFVVKDAGSDPDVTHGAEIHAAVTIVPSPEPAILIEGGTGIGRVTKPGLAVPVGRWAINPVPLRMMEGVLRDVFTGMTPSVTVHCRLSIPNGEELARKTLNARLGILGGLSILGTTGIVTPISARAWTDTMETAIDVALAGGSDTVVLSTGRTSELAVQSFLATPEGAVFPALPPTGRPLPEEAFVMMGDYVAHGLRACDTRGVARVVLAGQFAKLLKIACGHGQTHVSSSTLDLNTLAAWLARDPVTARLAPMAVGANTARQVLEASGHDRRLMETVCARARDFAVSCAPNLSVQVVLVGYNAQVIHTYP